jgi:hypothetical protein
MAWHSDSDELSEDDNVHNLVDDSGTTSSPEVGPSVDVMNKFWKRVAELTTRYHDNEGRWVGGREVKEWNNTHRTV